MRRGHGAAVRGVRSAVDQCTAIRQRDTVVRQHGDSTMRYRNTTVRRCAWASRVVLIQEDRLRSKHGRQEAQLLVPSWRAKSSQPLAAGGSAMTPIDSCPGTGRTSPSWWSSAATMVLNGRIKGKTGWGRWCFSKTFRLLTTNAQKQFGHPPPEGRQLFIIVLRHCWLRSSEVEK